MPNIGYFPVTGYPKPLAIPPSAFVPCTDTQDWETRQTHVQNRAVLVSQYFFAPVILPDKAIVKKLTFFGYRDDAVADMDLILHRQDRANNEVTMAIVGADWIGGFSSGYDDTISYAVIDNENYDYSLSLILNPNDDPLDVYLTGVLIDWS